MYSADGTNVCGSGGEELSLRGQELKVVKLCSLKAISYIHLFRNFCRVMYRLATMHFVTERWTDRPSLR